MASFPEMYIDPIKLVMLYCHVIYIYFLGGWEVGAKGIGGGVGCGCGCGNASVKIMTLVSFQKAKYSIPLVRSSYTLNP